MKIHCAQLSTNTLYSTERKCAASAHVSLQRLYTISSSRSHLMCKVSTWALTSAATILSSPSVVQVIRDICSSALQSAIHLQKDQALLPWRPFSYVPLVFSVCDSDLFEQSVETHNVTMNKKNLSVHLSLEQHVARYHRWWEWLRPLVTSINSIKLAVSNSFQLSLSLFICHLFLISSVSLSLLITLSLVSDVSYSILSRSSLISLLSLFISINHHEHSVWYVCNVFVCCVLRGAGWCCVLWCFVRCEICVVYSFVTPLRLLWLVLSLSLSLSFSLSLIFQQPLQ